MTQAAKDILSQARKLPEDDRVFLVNEISRTFSESWTKDEQSVFEEAARRDQQIESGADEALDFYRAMTDLRNGV